MLAVALALAALWVQLVQPLSHIALLRSLLDAAGPAFAIICTVDGPRFVKAEHWFGERGAESSRDGDPLASTDRPPGDCCLGSAITPVLPLVAVLAILVVGLVLAAPWPRAASLPPPRLSTWRLPRPRGPPFPVR